MSHQPERKEKNCLNCGTQVAGRFCQVCGQENIVTRQTAWGLIRHFVYDIFHFDGKFFDTLRHLLFRPGLVPLEYVKGKRMKYLDPIRMYLFTSALFFLIFFWITDPADAVRFNTTGRDSSRIMNRQERLDYASGIYKNLQSGRKDSMLERQLSYLMDTGYQLRLSPSKTGPLSETAFLVNLEDRTYQLTAEKYRPLMIEVDSNNSWLGRKISARMMTYQEKYGDDNRALFTDLSGDFLHKLPYLLFISLPFFALILKWLYRRRKDYYYSDHAVFTLYHYIFSFILLLVILLVDRLNDQLGWAFLEIVKTLLLISGGVYLFLAMKRFYAQGKLRTAGKFLVLNISGILVLLILFLIFLFFSFFKL